MKYKLKVYTIQEMGQRLNQEDSIFPAYGQETDADRLFILCDGMGGHDSGEVASQTVCEAMSKSVGEQTLDSEELFTDDMFNKALAEAFDALDAKDTGAVKKMGTTMTFLKLHAAGYTIAHIGDSRVYHVRPGETKDTTSILCQTVDHSLVNDLLKIGEITPEEARHFNQRNVITRAMQPNMERRPRADIIHGNDIIPDDYFFLCSDGMIEQMEDENLCFILSKSVPTDEEKVRILIQSTEQNKDNHTAILVHVLEVIDATVTNSIPNEETKMVPLPPPMRVAEIVDDETEENATGEGENKDETSAEEMLINGDKGESREVILKSEETCEDTLDEEKEVRRDSCKTRQLYCPRRLLLYNVYVSRRIVEKFTRKLLSRFKKNNDEEHIAKEDDIIKNNGVC